MLNLICITCKSPYLNLKNMKLYKDELIDHYRNPRNYRVLLDFDFSSEVLNPSCGDEIMFQGKVDKGTISDIAFQGKGCVISQATASVLSEYAKTITIEDIGRLSATNILEMIGLELGPTRLRCALLPLEALQQGIEKYKQLLI